MSGERFYPVGTPGQPWGGAEVQAWRERLVKQRSYATDVLAAIESLRQDFDVSEYGALDYDGERFPLLAIRSRGWREDLPILVVTGGVHGYETSGVHGALQYLREHGLEVAGRANLLVVPCVSPGPMSASSAGISTRWTRIAISAQTARSENPRLWWPCWRRCAAAC